MQRTWMYADDPALMYVLREQENARSSASHSFVGGIEGSDEALEMEEGIALRLNATI